MQQANVEGGEVSAVIKKLVRALDRPKTLRLSELKQAAIEVDHKLSDKIGYWFDCRAAMKRDQLAEIQGKAPWEELEQ